MAIKVLVVDDSSFFRHRVSEIINADPLLDVIGVAINGRDAVEQNIQLKPDVITMDIEMPIMNGIDAVREIMAHNPTPILMFSSLTHEGAQATLDALDAGALDFLPKKFEDIAFHRQDAIAQLQNRVRQLADKKREVKKRTSPIETELSNSEANATSLSSSLAPTNNVSMHFKATGKSYQLTVIGASTGGPVALQKILQHLPKHYPHPILLVQHMPAAFTSAFAERLNSLCRIEVKEAQNGDFLRPGVAYVAPGGKQMMLNGQAHAARLKIIDAGERVTYKPSLDITFGSAAKIYADKVLTIVLTGMGADGREGARMLQAAGSTIWAQDEESSVVYGMPQAVANAGISTENIPLELISERILIELGLT